MERKKLSGKEVRYLLKQNSVNLSWLSEQLGISAQALQERLKAQEFKSGYLLEIANVLGKDIFCMQDGDGNSILKQPVLDIRVCAGNGIGLEGSENKVEEYVSIPSMQGCIGLTVYGDSMTPKYCAGDVVFVRPIPVLDDIDYGSTYLVITQSDRLLKNIYPSDISDDCLRLTCINDDVNRFGERLYPDRDIKKEYILYLYKVVGSLCRTQI
jgi:hypothetical protein